MKMFTPCRGVEGYALARHTILSLSLFGRLVKILDLPLQNLSEHCLNRLLSTGVVGIAHAV
jgi:hypothetical protein